MYLRPIQEFLEYTLMVVLVMEDLMLPTGFQVCALEILILPLTLKQELHES